MAPVEHPSGTPVRPGRPAPPRHTVRCRIVLDEGELDLHLHIRRTVFVTEQHVFEGDDRDEHDDDAATVHVLGWCGGVAGGTVRLYPSVEVGCWIGDRLAVLPAFRRSGLGKPLVRFAVSNARKHGGTRMDAHVQLPNVAFFERLGWHPVGAPSDYMGFPHQAMAIDLRGIEE